MLHDLTNSVTTIQLCSAKDKDVQFLAQSIELAFENDAQSTAPEWVQVFPAGSDLIANDGRAFRLSDVYGLASRLNERKRPLLIDFDHRSHFQPFMGGDHLAAGWMDHFKVRNDALWAHVNWTKNAAAKIAALEYRYFSPEFTVNEETNEVVDLVAGGLVNRPAFEMTALAAQQQSKQQTEDQSMLKNIAKMLGLSEDASEADIMAAIQKKDDDHKTQLAAAATPPVDKFMPRADYDAMKERAETAESKLGEAEIAAFQAKVDEAIEQAVKDQKIAPGSKTHYASLCKDEDSLNSVLEAIDASPKVVTGSGLDGKTPPDASTELTAEEKKVAAQMGVSEEDFLKTKQADA